MGNSNSDNYFTEKPTITAAAFRRTYAYYWIDPKVNKTYVNRAYFQILKDIVQITPFEQWETLASTIQALNNNQTKNCLISCSSLPPEAYGWLQSESKINKLLLFCGS
jgi:hypothetical protein